MVSLNGDLDQMYTQMKFLNERGIITSVQGGIPQVNSSQWSNALNMIFFYRIKGWWNYRDELIKMGVCTEEQYVEALHEE